MEWGYSECGKYRMESVTASNLTGALHVIKEGFCKDETSCIGTEVNINPVAAEELLELCADAALDGVSVVAVEISTGEVVSACFNKLQVAMADSTEKTFFEVFAEVRCTQPSSRALLQDMANLDGRCKLFDLFETDCLFEIMFLGTLRKHRQKRLAKLLCKVSLDLARKLKYGPVSKVTVQDLGPKYAHIPPRKVTTKVPTICSIVCSSVATQKIGKSLNFTTHLRVSFTDYVYNGKTYVDRVGFDPYCEVMVKRLD